MHFNENSSREQAVTRAGHGQIKVKMPKQRKGNFTVCPVKTSPTLGKHTCTHCSTDIMNKKSAMVASYKILCSCVLFIQKSAGVFQFFFSSINSGLTGERIGGQYASPPLEK